MGQISVDNAGPNLWRIYWVEGARIIENFVPATEKPKVRAIVDDDNNVILLDQNEVEVGRYNETWRGKEFTCEETAEMMEEVDG